MTQPILRTSDIAKAVGIHPNTVRLYEEWGFLPEIPRTAKGYRQFTPAHLDQMKFARTALHGGWPQRKIRKSAVALVRTAAKGNLNVALELAYEHAALVQAEQAQAEAAANFLEAWVQSDVIEKQKKPLQIGETAVLLDVSTDMLRDWERNGHDHRPTQRPKQIPSIWCPEEIGRLRVIRLLRLGGYSTMSILRMLLQLNQVGPNLDLRRALDTPNDDEDILVATDQWLTTLQTHQTRAQSMISQLETMRHKYGDTPFKITPE